MFFPYIYGRPINGFQMNYFCEFLVTTLLQCHTIWIGQLHVSYFIWENWNENTTEPLIHIPNLWTPYERVASFDIDWSFFHVFIRYCLFWTEMIIDIKYIDTFISKEKMLGESTILARVCIHSHHQFGLSLQTLFIFILHTLHDIRNTTIRLYRHWIESINENVVFYFVLLYITANDPLWRIVVYTAYTYRIRNVGEARDRKRKKSKAENWHDYIQIRIALQLSVCAWM